MQRKKGKWKQSRDGCVRFLEKEEKKGFGGGVQEAGSECEHCKAGNGWGRQRNGKESIPGRKRRVGVREAGFAVDGRARVCSIW